MSLATLPPVHQPYAGIPPETAFDELRALIEDAIVNAPRSLQTTIGPSELGTPCDHCLAAKLAGWSKTEQGVAWLPFVGTAVHAAFEHTINTHEDARNAVHTTGRRWLTEQRVMVGHVAGQEVWGSTDVFDTAAGATGDWKIVGESTLRTARAHGPSQTYKVQAHLYGRGWVAAGYDVHWVSIWFLPRNDMRGFDGAYRWIEPYDEQVALDALARADQLARSIAALRVLGDDALNAWITALPRDPHCFDCARFADRPAATSPLADLLG